MRTGNLLIIGLFVLAIATEGFYIAGVTIRAQEIRDAQNFDLANKSIQLKGFEFLMLHPPVPTPSPKAMSPDGQPLRNL